MRSLLLEGLLRETATRRDVERIEENMATREELRRLEERMATKEELEALRGEMKKLWEYLGRIENRIARLEERFDSMLRWMIGLQVTMWATILALGIAALRLLAAIAAGSGGG